MNKLLKQRQGFTLLELIIYIGITSLVMVTLLRIVLVVTGTRDETLVVNTVQKELRLVMEKITTTARDAVEIDVNNSLFDVNAGKLELTMSGASLTPTIFQYSASGITMKIGAGSAVPITSQHIIVDQFLLTNRTPIGASGTVHILLHAIDASNNSDDEMTLRSAVTLRK